MVDENQAQNDASVWEFNYKPDKYVHSSWLSELPNGKLLEKLRSKDRDTSRLSHYLMSQLGFNGQFFFDFADPFTRIALWSGKDLERLVMNVGAMYYLNEITQVVTRDEVLAIRKTIGEETYEFILQYSGFFKQKPLSPPKLPKQINIHTRIQISGLVCLHTALRTQPKALRKRLIIKLPKEWFIGATRFIKQEGGLPYPKNECVYLVTKVAGLIKNGDDNSG